MSYPATIVVLLVAASPAALLADAAERSPVRVGCLSILPHLPVLIADRMDASGRDEIDIRLVRFNSDTSIESALRVGALDVAAISAPVALAMVADGVDIRIIGSCHRGGSRLVARKAENLSELAGKIIGVPGLDSSENLTLVSASGAAKLRHGLDFKTIGVSLRNIIDVFVEGKLDAIYLPEPFGAMAIARSNARPLKEGVAALTDTLGSVLVARAEFVETRPELVEAWLGLVVDACRSIERDIATTGGQQSAMLMSEFSECTRELAWKMLSERSGGLRFDAFLVETDALREYLAIAGRTRVITNSVDLGVVLRLEHISRVMKQ